MGNPKGSPYFSMSAGERRRKPITLTLPWKTLERLKRLCELRHGEMGELKRKRSLVVEELIEAAYKDAVKRR